MPTPHERELAAFADAKAFRGKGPLSVALVVTQHARKMGLPQEAPRGPSPISAKIKERPGAERVRIDLGWRD